MQSVLACRGLHILNSFMDIRNLLPKATICLAIRAIATILLFQAKGAKTDYCRILAKLGFLQRLTHRLPEVLEDKTPSGQEIASSIMSILFEFSQGEANVKDSFSDPQNLQGKRKLIAESLKLSQCS
ncbi:hypothetical protein HDU67_005343 [Dinochytrium kinnereticum]|nr:hypothetical protein HDU67_005343 [Dinochytrium kinnereticum]